MWGTSIVKKCYEIDFFDQPSVFVLSNDFDLHQETSNVISKPKFVTYFNFRVGEDVVFGDMVEGVEEGELGTGEHIMFAG